MENLDTLGAAREGSAVHQALVMPRCFETLLQLDLTPPQAELISYLLPKGSSEQHCPCSLPTLLIHTHPTCSARKGPHWLAIHMKINRETPICWVFISLLILTAWMDDHNLLERKELSTFRDQSQQRECVSYAPGFHLKILGPPDFCDCLQVGLVGNALLLLLC